MMKRIAGYMISLMLLGFTACEKPRAADAGDGASVPIAFHTRVDAAEDGGTGSARILIWRERDFHEDWIRGADGGVKAAPEYHVLLDEEINHYTYDSKIFFQTPYSYPANFTNIHATGYAPDNALEPVGGKGYTELKVLQTDGTADFLSCDGCKDHSASMNKENTFLSSPDKELSFRHLTSKITFEGERDEDMTGVVGVRNIRITVHNDDGKMVVPSRFKRYVRRGEDTAEGAQTTDYSTYVMSESVPFNPDGEEGNIVYVSSIPFDAGVTLGSCYVLSEGFEYGTEHGQFDPIEGKWNGEVSGKPSLRLTVKATLYDPMYPNETDRSQEAAWDYTVEDWAINTGDKFLPGYEYKVKIHFNRVGVAITAEKVPWGSEEIHEYPIKPKAQR